MVEERKRVKLKPGESLTCRIESPEPGGYLVSILPSGLPGFLPSKDPLKLGSVVPSTFVCMEGERALLAYAFMIGTTERVQLSTASDSENAFAVWADSYPRSERLKRAIDLFMPPLEGTPTAKKMLPEEANQFITKLESEKFTGCIKVDSEAQPSRSAALLYKGRAVGGIYTKRLIQEPYPIEPSLTLMLEDMRKTETDVEYYDLSEEIVLPLSSLFLGVAVDKSEDNASEQHAKQLFEQFRDRKSTACISFQQANPCALALFHRGQYKGAYEIEGHEFNTEESHFEQLVSKFSTAQLEAFILPEAATTSSMLFGYGLMTPPFTQPDEPKATN